jgi:CRISPR-associated exonuclease Cas4
MFEEDDFLPLSGIQHLVFCPRQWALIHLEQAWAENQWTAEGRERHRVVHDQIVETRPGVRVVRALPVHSRELGISGTCDAVEFVPSDSGPPAETAIPVEYKRGKPKPGHCDEAQLCAQAICLEEMTGSRVPSGALFYFETRRRTAVDFTAALRDRTQAAAAEMHRLYQERRTPAPVESRGCAKCSLRGFCLPKALRPGRSARRFLQSALRRDSEGREI